MEYGQRAVVILGLIGEAFQALEMEADVEQVLCSRLAEAVGADAAVCYVKDGSGDARALSCHPDESRSDALLQWAAGHELAGFDGGPVSRTHPELGQVLVVAPRPASPDGFDPGDRALAFARENGFTSDQIALLSEATPALLALMPHVVAATARRERTEAGRRAAREFGLTSRELEVLDLLAQGLLATSIASRLSLSPRTVHKHLGNIYDKLGVHDRLVAVSLARGRGLVEV